MRIAVYHNSPSGGAKRALFEMVRRLVQRHEVDVFTLSCASQEFCDLRSLVREHKVYPFEPLPLLPSPLGLFNHGLRTADLFRLGLVARWVAGEMNRGAYDVAFISNDQYTTSPMLLHFLKIPSVYFAQDPLRRVYDPPIPRPFWQLTGLRYWVDRLNALRSLYLAMLVRADRANLHAATVVLVNSYFSGETIYRLYGIAPRVCYLGVDTGVFRPLPLEKDGHVLSVGSLTPAKGFDFLIRSLALIPEGRRPLLLVVGNTALAEEQAYLEALANQHRVRIQFRVLVQDSELVRFYNSALATLYAPILEPFGFVPLESIACGTPVIGVAEGGVRETVRHGENGLLVDRDCQRFAKAIEQVLVWSPLMDNVRTEGPSYVREHWNWEDTVFRLESHLLEAIGTFS